MGNGKYITRLLILVVLAALSGCASYPISKNLKKEAKPVTLAQVTSDPAAVTGTTVIWGGRIIDTLNDTNGGAIYILELPLDSDGKPNPLGLPGGRFIAASPGFLDPDAFPNERFITVAGQIQGVRTEPVQKTQYTYPVLTIEQTHLWPEDYPEEAYYGYCYPGCYWDPGWWYGDGWYGGVGFYGYHRGYGGFHHGGFHGGGFRSGGGFHGGGGGHGGGR